MANNQIQSINIDFSHSQYGLDTIDLSYNQIKYVDSLAVLTNLKYLDLSNNEIEDISKLDKLQKLIVFIVINNQLRNIDLLKDYNKNMIKLSASNIELNDLDLDFFQPILVAFCVLAFSCFIHTHTFSQREYQMPVFEAIYHPTQFRLELTWNQN